MFGVDFVDLFSSLVFLDYISPFTIYYKAGLVVLNSLNFCLSEMLFISPSILNEILTRYSDLGYRFFPFSTLNISFHSPLACRVSAERSAVKHMGFHLYVTCCFSLAAFNILSLSLFFVILFTVSLDMFLFGLVLYGTLYASWTWDCFLSQVKEVFSYYIIKYILSPFLSSPFGTPIR